MAYLWTSFTRLRRRKGEGFNGLMPIEWTDIDAYCRHGFPLAPWEVRIIEQLDDFWLTRPAADAGNPDAEFHPSATPGKHVTVSTRPMSSNLFDIVFGAKKRT